MRLKEETVFVDSCMATNLWVDQSINEQIVV